MRPSAAFSAPWLRRAAALAGAVGLILLTSLAPATAAGRSTAAPQAGPGCPAPPAAPRLGVTVTGPRMYDPKTHSTFPCPSTVTVSQTRDLTNQMVKVSWTGFTPSGSVPGASGIPYSNLYTVYPVEVAECAGNSPGTAPADLGNPHCYYAGYNGLPYSNGKFGPSNDAYGTTTAQGTGYVEIQIETYLQNQGLGCDSAHDCSLLILPVEGGYPGIAGRQSANCGNHAQDRGGSLFAYGTAQTVLSTPSTVLPEGDTCSWPYRIVVPMHFAATQTNCGFSNPAFSVAGSPMMARAMTSWQSGLCKGAHPDPYSYDGSIGEPQARSLFQGGGEDVALTTDPATGPSRHPYTYAPVGITAASVAYWVDDEKTGEPYTNLKLTPLLLTKMLTQSYEYGAAPPGYACTPKELQNPPTTAPGCDPGVLHDPQTVLSDPEFRQLNPGLHVDEPSTSEVGVPTVASGNSDVTWEVTRWIAADKASASFLAGNVDQWGEHVNTFYLNLHYPTQQFIAQDPDGPMSFTYLPVFPASEVATYQADNWLPGRNFSANSSCPGTPFLQDCYPADNVEQVGQRSLFAILDQPDAAAFAMPTMKIENAAGDYVGPTAASMSAAVKSMVANGSNGITEHYNESSRDPAAYPLTMVVYAMVPTGGVPHHVAAKIAQWLDYIAGPGQHQGMLPSQLPPGYLPLTASMRAQTRKAAYDVLHETGDHARNHGGTKTGGAGHGNPGETGKTAPGHNGKSSPGASTASASAAHPGKTTVNAAFSSPFSGTGRLVLVIVLFIGVLLAIAGPAAVVLGKPSGRAAVIAGWHRVLALRHGTWIPRGRKQP